MNDTPARLLTLLSLLQTPREWPGSELAERLRVSARTIRRDIDRLRELGYPVEASLGSEGGYRLVAGAAMPPLLLDDEEAVAIAVGLRAGAGHAIEGIEEASVRALAKLEQVLPSRLRRRVSALQSATVAVSRGDGATVDPRTLTTMAAAVAGPERLRFGYRARDGAATRRLVEPYRLVSTGSRWYLVAYDLEREDWRTFRVDRVSEPFATGARFAARVLPMEAEEFVRRGLRGGETYRVEVTFAATVDALPGWLREDAVEERGGCRVRFDTGEAPEWVAARLALTGLGFAVREPAALADSARGLAERLSAAAGA
ncbi:transcriptional regulator [Streptomyces sp. WM4235]|uniref:helix-turn-helix transcriptional regulator n=1 Tax=unclassified Streptomyces TaxID=2593676 RepID=UPI0006AE4A59|nr:MULTISPECIES: YafY family protein [unclassified Streptomyces]KOU52210.1 transcriptional regulator [Streptomyces sp. WM4235]MCX5074916.1 YafY family transcriptional regulator [Streptomyces sp. NBC_00424]MCX5153466.1 YafY family transcriptional regulator [Streptomyces sp. NBC_00291]WUD41921.1 YafY family transcriptional regulator [Streptomyces sp. NBC_00513]